MRIFLRAGLIIVPAILAAPAAGAAPPSQQVISVNPGGTLGAGVAVSKAGLIYGVTTFQTHSGHIFELVPPHGSNPNWSTHYVKKFGGAPSDGWYPIGQPFFDPAGALYGLTLYGGATNSGTIYQANHVAHGDPELTDTLLHSFGRADGNGPDTQPGSLILGADGVLYGTTIASGQGSNACGGDCGTVFSLTPPAAGQTAWTYQTLYRFQGGADGEYPSNPLIQDSSGALYGSTRWGGNGACRDGHGCGTLFELVPPAQGGTTWTKTILYTYSAGTQSEGGGPDGGEPSSSLLMDQTGALFGAATYGGDPNCMVLYGCGVAFKLSPPSGSQAGWTYSVIFMFENTNHSVTGVYPNGSLIAGEGGSLLGTTETGGAGVGGGGGTVFRLSPPNHGGSAWQLQALYAFSGDNPNSGVIPQSGLVRNKSGLIGVTSEGGALHGVVYEVTP